MDTIDKVKSFSKKYIFIILSFIFFYIALYFKNADLLSVFTLLNVLSVLLILNILSKLKYSFILFLLLVVACTVDTFFAFYYKDNILFGILASILETNLLEATGVSMALFPVWMSVLVINFVLLFFAKKELKEIKLNIKHSLLLLGTYLVILASSFSYSIYNNERIYADFTVNAFGAINNIAKERSPLIYYTFFDLGTYYNEMSGYKKYKTDKRTLPNGVTLNKEKRQLEKIYIIIGESSSAKYFSLFGYPKETTPFLDSLKQAAPQSIIAYKGITPAGLTRDAIRLTLTYAAPNNPKDFYSYKNLVELAKDAGYETSWLSNQSRGGAYDTYIVMIGNEADHHRFEINPVEDFSLVKEVQPLLNGDKKQAFFLHTLGSHMPYKYGADSLDIARFPDNDVETSYLRTIHHVDRLLHKVYNIVKNDTVPAALFYYSDHGELIGRGHGILNDVTPEENRTQFTVPVISIMNDAAAGIVNDKIFKEYYSPEINGISTQNFINIVSESMGYDYSKEFIEKSIENGRYIYHIDTKCYQYKDLVE